MPATAVPLAVAYFTVIVPVLAAERLTTSVALAVPEAGLVTLTFPMAIVGKTVGLLIVTVAVAVFKVALAGDERTTLNAVAVFLALSGRTVRAIDCEVTPGAKVNVPLAAV